METNPVTQRQSGFTLTESAIVLGITGLIIGGIWSVASNVRAQQKNQDSVTELQTIVQNILALRGGQPFSNASKTSITTNMISAGAIPSAYLSPSAPSTTVLSPWGAGVTIWANTSATNPRIFRISFYNIPTYAVCTNLLLQGTSCQSGQFGCPTNAYTNGTILINPTTTISPDQTTGWQYNSTSGNGLNVSQALAYCKNNAINGGSVEFDYSL